MTDKRKGVILWLRRDLRLADHPALSAAMMRGEPVWPVFILDDVTMAETGAASRWRLEQSLKALAADISARGGRLILRKGDALAHLKQLIAETGAAAAYWTRLYTPAAMARDKAVKKTLRVDGIEATSFCGASLAEPWDVQTKTGGMYRVFTPFWKAIQAQFQPDEGTAAPSAWPTAEIQPQSLGLEDLALSAEMRRGAAVVAQFNEAGEAAAVGRLDEFLRSRLTPYQEDRNRLDRDGTSGLSAALALGEISPHRIWRATQAVMATTPKADQGGLTFLSEVAWRDFAWHLGYHTPELFDGNWRAEWDAFPWRQENEDAERWKRGLTGEPVIDAAMRELYVTGRMHNRARMLVASYLTKHLMTHWRVGADWFRECLTDYDPASNAMGWQWTAGSGPDAAPFFRIFNPATQSEKFDPDGAYLSTWLPERSAGLALGGAPDHGRLFFDACPASWELSAQDPAPNLLIALSEGRQRALAAYDSLKRVR